MTAAPRKACEPMTNRASARSAAELSGLGCCSQEGDVGAVIVTHSRADLAVQCAEAVMAQIGGENVVVVANLPDAARDLGLLRCPIVVNDEPCGYGENLNRGVQALGGRHRYLLLLNDDAIPAPGSVDALMRVLDRNPGAAIAGPRIVDSRGQPSPHAFRFPSLLTLLAAALLLPGWMAERLPAQCSQEVDDDQAEWLLGAALLVRTDAFAAVGGFDPGYFLNFEEIDLARRLARDGWAVTVSADALVRHIGGATLGSEPVAATAAATYVDSFSRYIALHWTARQRLVLGLLLAFSRLWNGAVEASTRVLSPAKAKDLARWRCAKHRMLPAPGAVRNHLAVAGDRP